MPPLQRPGTVCETEDPRPGAQSYDAAALGAPSCSGPSDWLDFAGIRPGPGFRWTVLRRHGKRPLAVLGRALLQANNRCASLHDWSEISIYETVACRFAASVRHVAPGASGPTWCHAWLCESTEAVRAVFHAHDPLEALPSCTITHPVHPGGRMPFDLADWSAPCDVAEMQLFTRAWAGLLAATFGLPVPNHAFT